VLSSHAEDGHQMYFGGSVIGKASTIGIGLLKMQQDIRILKQKCNATMIALCPGQAWWS